MNEVLEPAIISLVFGVTSVYIIRKLHSIKKVADITEKNTNSLNTDLRNEVKRLTEKVEAMSEAALKKSEELEKR